MQISKHYGQVELDLIGAESSVLDNYKYLCDTVLEPLRAFYGSEVKIHCGRRSPSHNAAVGGKTVSFHLGTGGHAAVDIDVPGHSIKDVFDWLRLVSHLEFDKVIMESNSAGVPVCVHIQTDRLVAARRQAFIGQTGACEHYTQVAVK